jgi:hypothetical protein
VSLLRNILRFSVPSQNHNSNYHAYLILQQRIGNNKTHYNIVRLWGCHRLATTTTTTTTMDKNTDGMTGRDDLGNYYHKDNPENSDYNMMDSRKSVNLDKPYGDRYDGGYSNTVPPLRLLMASKNTFDRFMKRK